MHWHYHELLPSLPYFFSLRLYASLIFLKKELLIVERGAEGVAVYKKQTKTNRCRRWVVNPIFMFTLSEKLPDFSNRK